MWNICDTEHKYRERKHCSDNYSQFIDDAYLCVCIQLGIGNYNEPSNTSHILAEWIRG